MLSCPWTSIVFNCGNHPCNPSRTCIVMWGRTSHKTNPVGLIKFLTPPVSCKHTSPSPTSPSSHLQWKHLPWGIKGFLEQLITEAQCSLSSSGNRFIRVETNQMFSYNLHSPSSKGAQINIKSHIHVHLQIFKFVMFINGLDMSPPNDLSD